MPDLHDNITRYARLLIKIGVNLQPGQPMRINAELGHRDFVRVVAAEAYKAGALYVDVAWSDALTHKTRYLHSEADGLDYAPEYMTARAREYLDRKFATLSLTGDEYPDAYEDIDPARMRRARMASQARTSFYSDAMMNDVVQWCVAGVPTPAWALKVFPGVPADQAVEKLWAEIFRVVRLNEPDPIAAWQAHDARLTAISKTLMAERVRAVRFFDPAPAEDGQPRTDLTVGLTRAPAWVAASAGTPEGTRFLPNMPTEEIFSTPDARLTRGWVRTSKPVFVMGKEVRDAYVRFEDGAVVDFRAGQGEDALRQLFEIDGARRLGEVALVDIRSPINQSGLVFGDTLFDENAACHIAFGKAYPPGVTGGSEMSPEALAELGVNVARAHEDVMIGTDTMNVTGIREDGSAIEVMVNGRFAPEMLSSE